MHAARGGPPCETHDGGAVHKARGIAVGNFASFGMGYAIAAFVLRHSLLTAILRSPGLYRQLIVDRPQAAALGDAVDEPDVAGPHLSAHPRSQASPARFHRGSH